MTPNLKGVAAFNAKRLCSVAQGPIDHRAVARNDHAVILVASQRLQHRAKKRVSGFCNKRRKIRTSQNVPRFITSIDTLYEHKVKLIVTAAADPADLYDRSAGGDEECRFAFDRTVSRLMEMQSQDYLALGHGEE